MLAGPPSREYANSDQLAAAGVRRGTDQEHCAGASSRNEGNNRGSPVRCSTTSTVSPPQFEDPLMEEQSNARASRTHLRASNLRVIRRAADVSRNLSGPDTVRTTEDMH